MKGAISNLGYPVNSRKRRITKMDAIAETKNISKYFPASMFLIKKVDLFIHVYFVIYEPESIIFYALAQYDKTTLRRRLM